MHWRNAANYNAAVHGIVVKVSCATRIGDALLEGGHFLFASLTSSRFRNLFLLADNFDVILAESNSSERLQNSNFEQKTFANALNDIKVRFQKPTLKLRATRTENNVLVVKIQMLQVMAKVDPVLRHSLHVLVGCRAESPENINPKGKLGRFFSPNFYSVRIASTSVKKPKNVFAGNEQG